MSSGPENRFIKSIHNKLSKEIYREKMHNPYRGGTADVWYSGRFDAWIEYKWVESLPKKGKLIPDLSMLQKQWLKGRYDEGRTVYVVVGCPSGAIVFSNPTEWETGLSSATLNKPEYVIWLTNIIIGGTGANSKEPKKRSGERIIRIQDPDHRVADL